MTNSNWSNQKKIINYFQKKTKIYSKIKSNKILFFIKKKELNIFKKIVNICDKDSIIDLASGSGFYLNNLNKKKLLNIYAVDASQKMLNLIKKKNVKKICSSIENLKLNKKFNKIFCFGLLEFVNDIDIVLKKIYKLSDKKSEIYLLLPKKNIFGLIYKIFHYFNGFNITIFNKIFIYSALNKNKFIIHKSDETFLSFFLMIKKK